MRRQVRTLFEGRVHALVGAVVVVVDERLHARARRRRDEGLDLALAGGGHRRRVDHELGGRLQEDTCSENTQWTCSDVVGQPFRKVSVYIYTCCTSTLIQSTVTSTVAVRVHCHRTQQM